MTAILLENQRIIPMAGGCSDKAHEAGPGYLTGTVAVESINHSHGVILLAVIEATTKLCDDGY